MTVATSVPVSPYKGLAPFEDTDIDALLFFGRERESEVIAANLIAARLTVLYGASGVGKSSILRAGVAHRLRQEREVDVVVFSTWTGNPTAALIEAVGGIGDSLVDALADATARAGGDLYLILDQFEEYFLYQPIGASFGAQLAEVVQRPGLRVNVLLGMREDALARLDSLKASIPNLLTNRLRLERLDRAEGRAAIVGPIGRFNALASPEERVEIEPELVEAVLDQVTAGRVELGVAGRGVASETTERGIEAPYLQLVLARLWDLEAERGSKTLQLQTLHELGGAERIVENHLERAMAELTLHEKGAAAAMYNFLVTPSGTKIAHGVRDLAGYAAIAENEASGVLQRLTAERIVRASSENGPASTRYEIFHDVLADAVIAWRARFEAERAIAEERDRHRRRQRRFLAIGIVALLGMAITAAIAIYALQQRSEAQQQAAVAKEQQATAEQALKKEAKATQKAEKSEQKSKQSEKKAKQSEQKYKQAAAEAVTEKENANASAQAERQARQRADKQHALADARLRLAQKETRKRTIAQRAAVRQRNINRAERLAAEARALLAEDPEKSVRRSLLAITAFRRVDQAPGINVESALREGLLALRLQAVLPGGGAVRVTRFSPDGSTALVAGAGGARLFQLTGRFAMRRLAPASNLADAVFSPDGRLVAAADLGAGHTVHVWDVDSGFEVATLRGHSASILSVAFSPNGSLIATGSVDGTARLWALAGGGLQLGEPFPHPRGISRDDDVQIVSFNPDGTLLLTVGGDRRARIFDVSRHALTRELDHGAQVNVARFSHDGRLVATAGANEIVRLWDARTGGELQQLQGTGRVADLVFSPDDTLLATAGGNDTIARVWNLATGSSRGAVTAHRSGLNSVSFNPDGTSVLTTGRDGRAHVAQSNSGFVQAELLGHGASVDVASFSPDGQTVLTGSADGFARVWDARVDRTGPRPQAIPTKVRNLDPPNVVAVSRSGDLAVTVGSDRAARLWLSDGSSLALAPSGSVNDASFSRDSKFVITASRDGKARVWTSNGVLISTLMHGSEVNSARLSSNGSLAVTGGEDKVARLWTTRTGTPLGRLEHAAPVNDARFSRDGKLVVTASDDRTAVIWRSSDGARLQTLKGHTESVVAATLSDDNVLVATGSTDTDARVWNARSGTPLAVLSVHQGSVNDVGFSTDARWLATAGPGAAGIWETRKRGTWPAFTYLVRPQPPTQRINDVAFSSRGWRLAIGSREGSYAYDCKVCGTLKQLTAIARARLRVIVKP